MRNLFFQLWHDESGTVAAEWAFVATILVLGAITGLVAVQQGDVLDTNDAPAAVSR